MENTLLKRRIIKGLTRKAVEFAIGSVVIVYSCSQLINLFKLAFRQYF